MEQSTHETRHPRTGVQDADSGTIIWSLFIVLYCYMYWIKLGANQMYGFLKVLSTPWMELCFFSNIWIMDSHFRI